MKVHIDYRNWVRNYMLYELDRENKEAPTKSVFLAHFSKLCENLERVNKGKEMSQ